MHNISKLTMVLLTSAAINGCNSTGSVGDIAMHLTSNYLGQYQITEIEGKAVVAESRPSLSLSDNGTIAGNSGCNNFSGKYEWVGGALRIGEMATTRKMCAPALMGQEQKLLGLLSSVNGAKLDGLDLVLTDNSKNALVKAARDSGK